MNCRTYAALAATAVLGLFIANASRHFDMRELLRFPLLKSCPAGRTYLCLAASAKRRHSGCEGSRRKHQAISSSDSSHFSASKSNEA